MKCEKCGNDNPNGIEHCLKCSADLMGKTKLITPVPTSTPPPVEEPVKSQLDFSPGEIFGGRYQIIEEIGSGGMGKVFKARDRELNIVVALKMIRPELSADPGIVARFKQELLLAREIFHENVIRIHDLGEVDHIKYISMNYVEGNSLKEIMGATGKLTVEKTVDIVKQVCSALDAAHRKGIIHRDLKPQNIMIDRRGNAVVLDFGIARSIQTPFESPEDSNMTAEGAVVGTPDYMSPEQIKGENVDAASDIYSMGVIMFEMITGKLPFSAPHPMEIFQKHVYEKPPLPSALNPQVPKKLESIILKCLEKRKRNRFRTVQEILDEVSHSKTLEIRLEKAKKRVRKEDAPQETTEEKSEPKARGSAFKSLFRIFLLILFAYIVISVIGIVNDATYGAKIDKLNVEYQTYYQNYFPLAREWLPKDQEPSDTDSWATYMSIFPPRTDEQERAIPEKKYFENPAVKQILRNPLSRKMQSLFKEWQYDNVEELIGLQERYGSYFKFDKWSEALKGRNLRLTIDTVNFRPPSTPDPELVRHYLQMLIINARIDFLEDNPKEGLARLYNGMTFAMDLHAAATSQADFELSLYTFKNLFRELIPLFLARDFQAGSSSSAETVGWLYRLLHLQYPDLFQAVFEVDLPLGVAVPDRLETLLTESLNRLEPREIFYKSYLELTRRYTDLFEAFNIEKLNYYAYEKYRFWKHGFSIHRYFHKEGIEFYQGLLDGLKYIRNVEDKQAFFNEYFQKNNGDGNIFVSHLRQIPDRLGSARILAKLALIILKMKKYGLDKEQVPGELLMDERTGKKLEISSGDSGPVILLDRNLKLDLATVSYPHDLQRIVNILDKISG